MAENQEVLVAPDFIQKIVEGETGIVDMIEQRFADHPVIILDVALAEGLARVKAPTGPGVQALGRLVRLSRVVPASTERDT